MVKKDRVNGVIHISLSLAVRLSERLGKLSVEEWITNQLDILDNIQEERQNTRWSTKRVEKRIAAKVVAKTKEPPAPVKQERKPRARALSEYNRPIYPSVIAGWSKMKTLRKYVQDAANILGVTVGDFLSIQGLSPNFLNSGKPSTMREVNRVKISNGLEEARQKARASHK